MNKKREEITPAEWQIMRIIWTLGPSPARTVIDMIQKRNDWSDSTIKTLLVRLVNKGWLKEDKRKRPFLFSATIKEQDAMDLSAETLFSQLCDMKKGETLLKLVKKNKLSKSDIEKLINQLQRKQKTAPDKVNCNCLPEDMNC